MGKFFITIVEELPTNDGTARMNEMYKGHKFH